MPNISTRTGSESLPAPIGLETTGNPIFVAPGSMLGAPGVSLPVLDDDGLPLGLQVLGGRRPQLAGAKICSIGQLVLPL